MKIYGLCCRRPEVWYRIEDVPDYAISNLGRVMRARPGKGTQVGKIITPLRHRDGHYYIYMPPGNGERFRGEGSRPRPKAMFVPLARLVAAAWLEWPADWSFRKHIVDHKDENPDHNCDTNLEWMTHHQHMKKTWARKQRERQLADDDTGRAPDVPRLRAEPEPDDDEEEWGY